ncbi:sensor histidine kinase [Lapidilactobacillus wuchangensis]|uniref:sensor histidine kinase n=1 Tax=Lapidilactobacillus wuchangensis TaxID=2486001 RepID=UPI000F78B759|nr:sensor histidine kinase [Lapidilactobacillus wuchangensis]
MKSSFLWLIRVYTAILTVTVVFATTVFVWSSIHSYNAQVSQAETTVVSQLSNTATRNLQLTKQFASQLVSDPNSTTNIDHYFSMSLMDYSDYTTDQSIESGKYFFWPSESRIFMIQHPEVKQLTLWMANQKKVFVATQEKSGGELVSAKSPLVQDDLAVKWPLLNQYSLHTDGVIGLTFKRSELNRQLSQLATLRPMQIMMRTDSNAPAFYFAGSDVTKAEQKRTQKAADNEQLSTLSGYQVTRKEISDYSIIMVTNRRRAQHLIFQQILPSMILGLVLLLGLSGGLHLVFRRYQTQLGMIVDTVNTFSQGDLDERIPLVTENNDLQVLTKGINDMLEEIHNHVYTIYQLQIANQTANIRALQAQINPHFLSNTLEYIRMAALDANQPELANVVYNFAALLRNNTDFSPRSTLKEELSFVEKYVFLYQVRFPDRLAYQIKIAPEVYEVSLPKFTLQPLVENYFVHGVDFSRVDNALSIKAWREADQIHILVKNNGYPLTAEQVAKVNQEMQDPNNAEKRTSIGLQNVYLRMKDYFGDSFKMAISSDGVSGVQLVLQFDGSGGTNKDVTGNDR